MPTQRRFEGSTLAAVLATVQKEMGANAKIASARKIRTGGFMGFFQRERYEVLVDVVDATAAPSAGVATSASAAPGMPVPASLLELAEAINESEATPGHSANTPPKVEPKPKISTETDTFAEVLSRVAYQAHLTSEDQARAKATDLPEAPVTGVAGSEPAAAAKEVDADAKADDETATDEDDSTASEEPAAPVSKTIPETPATFLQSQVFDLRTPPPGKAQALVRTRITDSPLARLGVPAQYIPATFDDDGLDKSLLAAFKKLPKAPEIVPSRGAIVAVVGDRNEAMKVAEDLCEKWGREGETVVVASRAGGPRNDESIIRNTRHAENSRRSWSRRDIPTVVAIDADAGSANVAWAGRMLAAFEPIATWGVADATRKAEDIAAWADALGGVDALALNGASRTVSPASVLATGIPVDSVDGHGATPAYWTSLITERLQTV